jgi:hypothetical protein
MRDGGRWHPWIGCSLVGFQSKNWIFAFCLCCSSFALYATGSEKFLGAAGLCDVVLRSLEDFSGRMHRFQIAGPVQSPCLFTSISPILAQHASVVSIFDFGVDGSEPRVRCYVSLTRFSFSAVLFGVIFGSSHLRQCVLVSPRCTSSFVQGLRFSLGQARLFLLVN